MSKDIKIFTQYPLLTHIENDFIKINIPPGCHSIERYCRKVLFPDISVDSYTTFMNPSKIYTVNAISDIVQIVCQIKHGNHYKMFKVIWLNSSDIFCLKHIIPSTTINLQQLILNSFGKCCLLFSQYTEEIVMLIYDRSSNDHYFLTKYCPFSLHSIYIYI
jgi:hypothetical protein